MTSALVGGVPSADRNRTSIGGVLTLSGGTALMISASGDPVFTMAHQIVHHFAAAGRNEPSRMVVGLGNG